MKKYYSKLLLFGEYTIIKGSAGLAIPYKAYFGTWTFEKEPNVSNGALKAWYDYLVEQEVPRDLGIELNLTQFKQDIDRGLTFQSNIPLGYGVGSSGALTVAFFEKYVTDFHMSKKNIFKLKSIFIWLESFFHGGGSGVDPLICYLQQPLLLAPKGALSTTQLPSFPEKSNIACFLMDTNISRSTERLVNIFHEKFENSRFQDEVSILSKLNDDAIQAFFDHKIDVLFKKLNKISDLQYHYFEPMIPETFQSIWQKSLTDDKLALKLCGAGGGGFILGFSKDWENTQQMLSDYNLQTVLFL